MRHDLAEVRRWLQAAAERYDVRMFLVAWGLGGICYRAELVEAGAPGIGLLLTTLGAVAAVAYLFGADAWRSAGRALRARPVARFKAMADRAERLAAEFARHAAHPVWENARSAVLEMVELRDELSRLEVHLPVTGVVGEHPIQVREACEANENTLKRFADWMRAGDLRTARAEYPMV